MNNHQRSVAVISEIFRGIGESHGNSELANIVCEHIDAAVASLIAERDALTNALDAYRELVPEIRRERDEARAHLAAANERAEKAEAGHTDALRKWIEIRQSSQAEYDLFEQRIDRLREENAALEAEHEAAGAIVEHDARARSGGYLLPHEGEDLRAQLRAAHAAVEALRAVKS
jgi:chromosome segregation ATPase